LCRFCAACHGKVAVVQQEILRGKQQEPARRGPHSTAAAPSAALAPCACTDSKPSVLSIAIRAQRPTHLAIASDRQEGQWDMSGRQENRSGRRHQRKETGRGATFLAAAAPHTRRLLRCVRCGGAAPQTTDAVSELLQGLSRAFVGLAARKARAGPIIATRGAACIAQNILTKSADFSQKQTISFRDNSNCQVNEQQFCVSGRRCRGLGVAHRAAQASQINCSRTCCAYRGFAWNATSKLRLLWQHPD